MLIERAVVPPAADGSAVVVAMIVDWGISQLLVDDD